MKTLVSYYQEIKQKLSQLEGVEIEQVVSIVRDEISKLTDFSSEYISELTPVQARLATVMLKVLNQYISILILVKPQKIASNASEIINSSGNLQPESQVDLTLVPGNLLPFDKIAQIDKNLKTLTSLDYYQQALSQQVRKNREVVSSLLAGGVTGTLAGGYIWGLIGAITGGVIGKIVQQTQLTENTYIASQLEPPRDELKISIDTEKLLDYLYQAFQSIDLTVAAYGVREDKAIAPGLENNLDLLEYLQDLMADGLDAQTQLPTAVRRRIEQAATILRRYGIETRVYQPIKEENLEQEAWAMFYFEPSLDPQTKDYITLKHAFIKDNQVLLPGSVIEPASQTVNSEQLTVNS